MSVHWTAPDRIVRASGDGTASNDNTAEDEPLRTCSWRERFEFIGAVLIGGGVFATVLLAWMAP